VPAGPHGGLARYHRRHFDENKALSRGRVSAPSRAQMSLRRSVEPALALQLVNGRSV
jgi:hypothetical protein